MPSYKLPLFYLIDSILRSVAGPYVHLFGSHLTVLFKTAVDGGMEEKDRARLDYLLSTWERRGMLRSDVLTSMRNIIGARRVTLAAYPHMQAVTGPVRVFSGGEPAVKQQQLHGGQGGPHSRHGQQQQRSTGNEVRGFVAETLVSVSLDRAQALQTALREHISSFDRGGLESSSTSCKKALARLSSLLEGVQVPPPVPPMIFGLLPLEPSKEFKALAAVQHINTPAATTATGANGVVASGSAASQAKIPMPKFRTDQLERDSALKESALKALIGSRPYISRADGLRFRTETQLAAHLDMLFARNRERKRVEAINERVFRAPFCTISQWVSDFNKLQVSSVSSSTSGAGKGKGKGSVDGGDQQDGTSASVGGGGTATVSRDGLQADEERVLLADDYFPRCPVSKEVFEHIWDDEDGDIYYRNAVRVLLTEVADPQLFKHARPTGSQTPNVRYCVIHKSLVLDGWLEAGKATGLKNAVERYQSVGKHDLATDLLTASGVEGGDNAESNGGAEDDVFVLLELAIN